MSDDRPVATLAVVDAGRPSPQRIHASASKVAEEMGQHVPVVEVRGDAEMKESLPLILATLEANGIRTRPEPPVRQPKRKPPTEVQDRLKADAQAKRDRRRQKRLQQTLQPYGN